MPSAPRGTPQLDFPLVGVGASTGGLVAFRRFLGGLPAEPGMAFVVLQHRDPGFESELPALLARHTAMPVEEVTAPVAPAPGRVYVAPPDKCLTLENGVLLPADPDTPRALRTLLDHFFRSLAHEQKELAAVVLLSGTGVDGAAGARAVKEAGGVVLAQEPATAEAEGMPRAVVEEGLADQALPPEEIGPVLLAYFEERRRTPLALPLDEEGERQLDAVLELLRREVGADFRSYRQPTLVRRLQRRLNLHGTASLAEYLRLLDARPREREALARDFVIGVTDFFRDGEAFQALTRHAIPAVLGEARGRSIRVWVPGCATGEEAYSIAILFLERLPEGEWRRLRIFATDVAPASVEIGRAGVYPASALESVSSERLARFFMPLGDDRWQVAAPVRDTVTFAVHNLLADPPFARMDLVSCRNLLIYLREEVQSEVRTVFHFALRPGGFLFLGTAESAGQEKDLFEPVAKKQRLYRRVGPLRAPQLKFPAGTRERGGALELPAIAPRRAEASGLEAAERLLLEECTPPAVLVDGDYGIRYLHGELSPWLRLPRGGADLSLLQMLDEPLRTRLRSAIHSALRHGEPVAVRIPPSNGSGPVVVTARPARSPEARGLALLTFQPGAAAQEMDEPAAAQLSLVSELESELAATRADLRSTVEELEASNEELKASNEEILSINEELQSANEELETTSEELRSLNQELASVNAELKLKVRALEEARADLANLLHSSRVATVFLDRELRVKRFTAPVTELLHLIPGDSGRPLADVAWDIEDDTLLADAARVVDDLVPREREVRDAAGRWWARRILPYRTPEERIEGVVVTFHDVTDLKRAAESVRERERQQAAVKDLGLRALRGIPLAELFREATEVVAHTLEIDFSKLLVLEPDGMHLRMVAGHGWRDGLLDQDVAQAELSTQAGYTLRSSAPVVVEDLGAETRFAPAPFQRAHGVVSLMSVVVEGAQGPFGVLGADSARPRRFAQHDVDFLHSVATVLAWAVRRRETDDVLRASERRVAERAAELEALMDAVPVAVVLAHDPAAQRVTGNAAAVELFRLPNPQANLSFSGPEADRPHHFHFERQGEPLAAAELALERALGGSRVLGWEGEVVFADGSRRWVTGNARPLLGGDGRVRGAVAAFLDITERKAADAERAELLRRERRAHAAAEAERRRLYELFMDAPARIAVHEGEDLRITFLNRAAAAAAGEQQLLGRPLRETFPELEGQGYFEAMERVRETGESVSLLEKAFTIHVAGSDESRLVHVNLFLQPVRAVDGSVDGVMSFSFDVTHEVETRRKLELAMRLQAEESQRKDEFLAVLGHELRNPLAGLDSGLRLLERRSEEPQLAEATSRMRQGVRQVASLLDDLLDVTRVSRGKLELRRQPLDLREVVERALAGVREEAERRRQGLVARVPPVPVWVHGDATRLEQVIANLLSNAVKYTPPEGAVELSLALDGDDAVLRVRDTGVGIAPDLLERIFEPFMQARGDAFGAGGLGIGLTLVRQLVELHGGSVMASSEGPGKGAELTVRLPRTAAPRPAAASSQQAAPRPRPGLRVLVVDDNRDAADGLAELLRLSGCDSAVAHSGEEGLAALAGGERDAVLLDISLPDMTGYQLVEQARQRGILGAARVIALSGFGHDEAKRRSRQAGIERHLVKPVEIETLLGALAEV